VIASALRKLQEKQIHRWVGPWLRDRASRRRVDRARVTDVLFCVCDHHEPLWGNVDLARGLERVERWRTEYPKLAAGLVDAGGRGPRHSFFYPGDQYDAGLLEGLAELARGGHGEFDVHLHHEDDTEASLRAKLEEALANFTRHGLLPIVEGKPRWSFIHGNWCLANARDDGRMCGVDAELPLLASLGCYADLTFPSAPDESQPSWVNAIAQATGDLARKRSYEGAETVGVGTARRDGLLLVQGPLALALRPGARGVRIENGDLQGNDPPTLARFRTWLDQHVHVRGRPEWCFIKVHTHGAPEKNAFAMLGAPTRRFHEEMLAECTSRGLRLHYVSARELVNVAEAAMRGERGDPRRFFDVGIPRAAVVGGR
jgi:hypothetical protein